MSLMMSANSDLCHRGNGPYLRGDFVPLLATHVSGEAAETDLVPVEVRLRGFILHGVSVRQQTANPLQESETVLLTPVIYTHTHTVILS